MPVYAIQAGENGPVKLGHSNDPDGRLCELQVAHWVELKILRLWRGSEQEELALHARFAELRLRGEWFSFSNAMLGDVGLVEIVAAQSSTLRRAIHQEETGDPVLDDIHRFLNRSGMTATMFGVKALNDPTLVHELRKGRECKRATRSRIMDYIEQQSLTDHATVEAAE